MLLLTNISVLFYIPSITVLRNLKINLEVIIINKFLCMHDFVLNKRYMSTNINYFIYLYFIKYILYILGFLRIKRWIRQNWTH